MTTGKIDNYDGLDTVEKIALIVLMTAIGLMIWLILSDSGCQ